MGYQRWCLLVLLAVIVGHVGASDSYRSDHFHCGRPGQECHNGGLCDTDNGRCYECPVNTTGYDCGFDTTGYTEDNCTRDCKNGATCYYNTTTDRDYCLCPPDYRGWSCSSSRVYLNCYSDSNYVIFYPILPFDGIVFIGEDPGKERCHLPTRYNYYRMSFDIDDCNTTMTNENGNITYTTQLTIQYDPVFQTDYDLTIDLSCVRLDNTTWENTNRFGIRQTSDEKIQGQDIQSVYFPAYLGFWDNELQYRRYSVTLGQRIAFVNRIYDVTVYQSLKVESCTFSTASRSKSVLVVENGCPTDRSEVMDMTGEMSSVRYRSGVWPVFRFNIVRFGTEPTLVVSCRVRLCKEGNDACRMPDCEDQSNRVRRDADEIPDKEQTVTDTLTIVDLNNEEERAGLFTADKCMEQPVIQSVGISLVVLLSLLLLVCVILVFCLCRSKLALRKKILESRYSDRTQDPGILGRDGMMK